MIILTSLATQILTRITPMSLFLNSFKGYIGRHLMSNCQVTSIMNGRLVSFIAIFLIISVEVMGGAEGNPKPNPYPGPLPSWASTGRFCQMLPKKYRKYCFKRRLEIRKEIRDTEREIRKEFSRFGR